MLKAEGFSPADPSLFNKFVSSLAMGLAQQASLNSSGAAFCVAKRRQFYLSHLPAFIPNECKSVLLTSQVSLVDSLFDEEILKSVLSQARDSSTFKSHQALVDLASKPSSSSPRRSYSRSRYQRGRRRSRSPSPKSSGSRTPKRVRFNPRSTAKSPPPPQTKDFHK